MAVSTSLVFPQVPPHCARDSAGHQRRNRITNLDELVHPRTAEVEPVWESLEPRGFAD
jgi:hypothetical protein